MGRNSLSLYVHTRYKATKEHSNADTLSRFQVNHFENEQSLELIVNLIHCNQLEKLPISLKDVEAAMKTDSTLLQVCEYIRNGWPAHKCNIPKAV